MNCWCTGSYSSPIVLLLYYEYCCCVFSTTLGYYVSYSAHKESHAKKSSLFKTPVRVTSCTTRTAVQVHRMTCVALMSDFFVTWTNAAAVVWNMVQCCSAAATQYCTAVPSCPVFMSEPSITPRDPKQRCRLTALVPLDGQPSRYL